MVAGSAVVFKIVTFSLTHTHSQEQRAATKENVERRMARTADELLEEEEGEEEPEEEESDDEEEGEEEPEEEESDDEETVPYNPKNLPLGWDGKVKEE